MKDVHMGWSGYMKKEAAQCQLNDFRFDYLYYLI